MSDGIVYGNDKSNALDVISVPQSDSVDMVNEPPHYKIHEMECIDEMVAVFGPVAVIKYCGIAAWKYRYRFTAKGNPEQDMAKSEWYIRKAMELRDKYEVYDV